MAGLRGNLRDLVEYDPERRVVKLLHDSERLRLVLFCLRPGQEVPEHATPSEVVFLVLEGEGEVGIGGESHRAGSGDILSCPPDAPHSLKGEKDFAVLAFIAPRPE